jgi:hypothetical protein
MYIDEENLTTHHKTYWELVSSNLFRLRPVPWR